MPQLSSEINKKLSEAMGRVRDLEKQAKIEKEQDQSTNDVDKLRSQVNLAQSRLETTRGQQHGYSVDEFEAKQRAALATKDIKNFKSRASAAKENIKAQYANDPKKLERYSAQLDRAIVKEEKQYEKRRKSAQEELRMAQRKNEVAKASINFQESSIKKQRVALDQASKQLTNSEKSVSEKQKEADLIKENVKNTEKILSDRRNVKMRTPFGEGIRDSLDKYAIDPRTGKLSLAGSFGSELTARSVDTAVYASTLGAFSSMQAGMSGGGTGVINNMGQGIGGSAQSMLKGLGSAVGASGIGGFAGDVAKAYVDVTTQAWLKNLESGYLKKEQNLLSSRLTGVITGYKGNGDPILGTNNFRGPMMPGLSSGETSQMIQSAGAFGIKTDSASSSTFMQFAALKRVWGDISAPLKDMIGVYDDQAKAVQSLDAAYGYARKTAVSLGMDVGQAAKMFTEAGRAARFAGVDANIATNLLQSITSRDQAASYRTVGLDPTQLGKYVGDLISAPKNMDMSMQYYFASGMGKDKSMNPLTASFMAQYGDPNKFKYDANTGVGKFDTLSDPVFLRNMKDQQMQLMDSFTKSTGGNKAQAMVLTQKAMAEAFGIKKEQNDLLMGIGKQDIGKDFAQKFEQVTKNPLSYLTHLQTLPALDENIARAIASKVPQMGFGVDKVYNLVSKLYTEILHTGGDPFKAVGNLVEAELMEVKSNIVNIVTDNPVVNKARDVGGAVKGKADAVIDAVQKHGFLGGYLDIGKRVWGNIFSSNEPESKGRSARVAAALPSVMSSSSSFGDMAAKYGKSHTKAIPTSVQMFGNQVALTFSADDFKQITMHNIKNSGIS